MVKAMKHARKSMNQRNQKAALYLFHRRYLLALGEYPDGHFKYSFIKQEPDNTYPAEIKPKEKTPNDLSDQEPITDLED